MIDTGKGTKTNKVTAVQLELQYDPKMITNVRVVPGSFFTNPVPLVTTNDTATGKLTYALAISPTATGATGSGTVATVQFQSVMPKGGSTQLSILPTTLVTAQGVAESVFLKGTTAIITAGGNTAGVTVSPTSIQSTQSGSPKVMKNNNSQASEKSMKGNQDPSRTP
jgi:hypothetical protein